MIHSLSLTHRNFGVLGQSASMSEASLRRTNSHVLCNVVQGVHGNRMALLTDAERGSDDADTCMEVFYRSPALQPSSLERLRALEALAEVMGGETLASLACQQFLDLHSISEVVRDVEHATERCLLKQTDLSLSEELGERLMSLYFTFARDVYCVVAASYNLQSLYNTYRQLSSTLGRSVLHDYTRKMIRVLYTPTLMGLTVRASRRFRVEITNTFHLHHAVSLLCGCACM